VTSQSKDGGRSEETDLKQFVQQQVSALSKAFAEGPLMQLRMTTPGASVTMVKVQDAARSIAPISSPADRRSMPARMFHEYLADGEPGRAYDTVNADVVGIFHAAPDLPASGEHVELNQILGYVEALKLRTPVKSSLAGRLVGQVAEEGQAVDFGETLFVVDGGPIEPQAEEPVEELEPPRI
jgi:acetyl-CoA carboxylase biotin carboxyl carrier protein